jgi:iron(III) transport system substrate-binding protein
MIHHHGEGKARDWAAAIVANRRVGAEWMGDTANAAGIGRGDFALSFINTYYLGYMRANSQPDMGPSFLDRIGIAWMDGGTAGVGQPVNVTGAAIHSKTLRSAEARRLIEWLLSRKGQTLLSEHVFKYPVVPGVPPSEYLRSLGSFVIDTTDLNDLEFLYDRADQIMRDVGWEQKW